MTGRRPSRTSGAEDTLRIGVTGAGGLVGRALCREAESGGHSIRRFVRREPRSDAEVRWVPEAGTVDEGAFDGLDAIVHLAGENVAAGRWTEARKARIRDSRVLGTRTLVSAALKSGTVPPVWVQASAIGFYGGRGDEELDEASSPGTGFLPEVCVAWEREADFVREAGSRTVFFRIGLVLSGEGGALARMLPAFRFGVGGRLGHGRQWMSWLSRRELVSMILWAVETREAAGVYNAVTPDAVRNRDFTRTLGQVLGRPTFAAVPAFALRLLLGEMAEGLLLEGARVAPRRLVEAGYRFRDPELEPFLREELS